MAMSREDLERRVVRNTGDIDYVFKIVDERTAQLQGLQAKVSDHDALFETITRRLADVRDRLDSGDDRLPALADSVARSLDSVLGRIEAVEERYDALGGRLDGIEEGFGGQLRMIEEMLTGILRRLPNPDL